MNQTAKNEMQSSKYNFSPRKTLFFKKKPAQKFKGLLKFVETTKREKNFSEWSAKLYLSTVKDACQTQGTLEKIRLRYLGLNVLQLNLVFQIDSVLN